MTVVAQLQSDGIRRLGAMKSGFRYRLADGRRAPRRQVERIQLLKIPPAWTAVAIDRSESAWIQAVGKDKAGRWQYVYHQRAVARRERRKHTRLIAFTKRLPLLRARVARDLARTDYSRDRVLACMLRILSICFLRPGSEEYASENGSYGIATLRNRHVDVRGRTVRLRFNGKSGKGHSYQIENQRIASVVRALRKAGGKRVFTFQDESGAWKEVHRQHINAYIKDAMGGSFSAKDFRTWAGTITCACALARIGFDPLDSPTALRKKIVAAVKETAETLGNTPAVCRSSYISASVIRAYEAGRMIRRPVVAVGDLATSRGRLHHCERSLVRVLEEFSPKAKRGRRERRVAARRQPRLRQTIGRRPWNTLTRKITSAATSRM